MTSATLFGLALAPLYAAIAKVESDRGATSENIYQIRNVYVNDVNRIIANAFKTPSGAPVHPAYFYPNEVNSKAASELMMKIYWEHWGIHYQRKTGKPVTYEVLARIHNGGPLGWKKSATDVYWRKVKEAMKE